ncbi:head fiber protein [Hymenobacter glacieicola]|uniref:Uncharacterized protein n=1 Tax=Hymenobacter glacieicola TaxID=1562124 RepID=A0ABQ1X571_9BACT|nr:head fiber protein [Hymenobacter glacieicola]GGG60510.1 hypothetical protein GCM10011378_40660 [Hymenobacter glacieicola]
MSVRSKDELLQELMSAVRTGGQGGKTTAADVRAFLTSLTAELYERTAGSEEAARPFLFQVNALDDPGHYHLAALTVEQVRQLVQQDVDQIVVLSEARDGHQHDITFGYDHEQATFTVLGIVRAGGDAPAPGEPADTTTTHDVLLIGRGNAPDATPQTNKAVAFKVGAPVAPEHYHLAYLNWDQASQLVQNPGLTLELDTDEQAGHSVRIQVRYDHAQNHFVGEMVSSTNGLYHVVTQISVPVEQTSALQELQVRTGGLETGKVDKVSGKQLSTEDFTTAEKNKLADLSTLAESHIHYQAPGAVTAYHKGHFYYSDAGILYEYISDELQAASHLSASVGMRLVAGGTTFSKEVLDALVGTSGIPSATNKFITNSDPRVSIVKPGAAANSVTIVAGNQATIEASGSAIIGGSGRSTITGNGNAVIIGGDNNKVNQYAGAIIGGGTNVIGTNGYFGGIVGGVLNNLNAQRSGMVGGEWTNLNGYASATVGGAYNDLNGRYSALIGGYNFKAPSIDEMVFVPRLYLFKNGGTISMVSASGSRHEVSVTNTGKLAVDGVEVTGGSGGGTTYDDSALRNRVSVVEDSKVDKVAGKGLSQEDFTSAEKTKLAGLQNAVPYSLPAATITTLGGVKQGTGINIASDGTISATGGSGFILEFVFEAGFTDDVTRTMGSNQAATYQSQQTQNVANVRYRLNGTGVALPFTVAVGDTLELLIARTTAASTAVVTLAS